MGNLHVWLTVAVIALVTALLRFLPFLVFRNGKVPRWVERLGVLLPYAIMGMLVVYCLKDMRFDAVSSFLPEAMACAVVVGLHLWRRNTLLSIVGGTVAYMLLVQMVF
jgi:branched-subunit amino acid transport protein AzlD